MRALDLLAPYLAESDRVLDESASGTDLQRLLFLPDAIPYERGSADGVVPAGDKTPIEPRTLVLGVMGPDRAAHGGSEDVTSIVARLATGARAVILFGWNLTDLPYHRILDPLAEHRCQVIQVADIELGALRSAAVIERVTDLVPPRDATGSPIQPPPADADQRLAMQIRLANESVFGEARARAVRSTLAEPATAADQVRFEAYRAQAERQLQERDARIKKLETRLAKVEGSSSLKLGQTLTRAARSPSSLVRLPFDLIGIWRSRRR
jgi:hypothetical protein